ncbi:hypothetical protein CFHF_19615 [Caulobacter flavus]|uniref:XRE family transcriptional regulator n=2 Tax=Caulobacter flavus TaxID=1679497 RepID=A0A2N5CNZ1_9CAUL|nr:hypothetical protein C1707_21450 [Caulobacter flavus]PLR08667.1 hypothetical protein CFHF_19615 [Caulobacter flavus]
MGVSIRTYRDFSNGKRAYDFNKVRLFARATRTDPTAIHLGIQFNWPELPILLMDNKMATAAFVMIRDLHGEHGARLASVPAKLLVAGFRHISEEIRKYFERRDASIEAYIERAIAQTYGDPDEDEEPPEGEA